MFNRKQWIRGASMGILSAVCGAAIPAGGQTTQPAPSSGPSQAPEAPGLPDITAATRGMTTIPGLITMYQPSLADIKQDPTRLLGMIPRPLLNQDLLLAVSGSRGSQMGYQGDTYVVRFVQSGRRIVMVEPDYRYIQKPDSPVTTAVERTYTPGSLVSMPIVAANGPADSASAFLVDLSGIFFSGLGMGAEAPRKDVSEYTNVKGYPDNILVDCNLATTRRGGTGWDTQGISYSLRRLPDMKSYSPRLADERVGYFITTRMDWNSKMTDRELKVRYVNRWNIKKKDPSLELSPPDRPIVFILEKTVPLQWRKYVADGVLEWNKAFEKLGITGAIVVQQQTEDNEFAAMEAEDARYNFIRWIVTGRAFAMGPSRADPRTGQILDADIIIDDALLRTYQQDLERLPALPAALGVNQAKEMLANPGLRPEGVREDEVHEYIDGCSAHDGCSYAQGMSREIAMLQMIYAAQGATGRKLPDKLMGEVIKEIVTHEVGHCLGLRHNFKASAWLGIDEIKKRRDTTDDATVASVMDYMPLELFKGDAIDKLRHVINPTIGPYDYWAIEYGYKTFADDEAKALSALASLNAKTEYAYLTDEDTSGVASPDPLSNRYDLGPDALAWSKLRTEMADLMLKELPRSAVKENEPGYYLLRAYNLSLQEKYTSLQYVARNVGGMYFTRNRWSDPDAKPTLTLVDPKTQRSSLETLVETVFKDDYLLPSAELVNYLTPTRWPDWDLNSSMASSRVDYPVHDNVSRIQGQFLSLVMSPTVIQRVYDAELKTKTAEKFTAAELITKLRDGIWDLPEEGEKFTDEKPGISSIRRNLQRQHLRMMMAAATSAELSPDVKSMLRMAARELSEQIGRTLEKAKVADGSRLDFATRAHLTECKSAIDRALSATLILSNPSDL